MKHIIYILFILSFSIFSCVNQSSTRKIQNDRNNTIDVRDKLEQIIIEDVLIGNIAPLFLMNNYLFIGDIKSLNELVHIFDKNTFKYICSTGIRGAGPHEITNIGHIAMNEEEGLFYISDHGKLMVHSYEIDSVIINPLYIPKIKTRINNQQFPGEYKYINDTMSIGIAITPIGNSNYQPSVAKWNMITGEISPMKYEHPNIDRKRITFDVSLEDSIYVEGYLYNDLMTICDINGRLKSNIYGKNWNTREKGGIYYESIKIINDGILALYSGENMIPGGNKGVNHSKKFLYFNKEGEYICTLETGHNITYFCYDKDNNRILMSLNDDFQFAYLDLDSIL